jgi:hypothetical protein
MKRIKTLLKSRSGTAFPMTVAVTLSLLLILCGISEYMRLSIIASGVRDAVQSAVISTVNDNYSNVYQGVREGYSGGYLPSGSSWAASLNYGDIYGRIDQTLGTHESSGYHIKYAGSSMEYRLSGLSVSIKNAPLAPADSGSVQKFLVDATVTLEVPVSFAGKILPPMCINLKTQAQYTPKF